MFSQKQDVIKAMDKYVILSLHTDGKGANRDAYADWCEELTGSRSVPLYVLMDVGGDVDKRLATADYNVAVSDGFAKKVERGVRRFDRRQKKRDAAAARPGR